MAQPQYHKTAKEQGMVPIPAEDLSKMIGKPIHLSWARNGARWILVSIEGGTIHLRTEKTNRLRTDKAENAMYVRRYERLKENDNDRDH